MNEPVVNAKASVKQIVQDWSNHSEDSRRSPYPRSQAVDSTTQAVSPRSILKNDTLSQPKRALHFLEGTGEVREALRNVSESPRARKMIESATRNYQPSGPTLPSRPISGPPPCKEVPPAADAAEEPAAYSPPLGSHRTTGDFGDFGGAGERSEKDSIVSSAGVANANQGTLKKHKSLTFQQETKSAAEKLFEGFSTNHGSEGSGEGSQANSRVAGSLGDEFDESIDVARISHLSRRTYSFQQNAAAQYMKAPRIALRGHLLSVTALAVLRVADDKNTWILSGSEDKTLKVWSLVTGELVATLTGHVQKVSAIVSCYGEGMRPIAITASWDETIRIWPMECCLRGYEISAASMQTVTDESVILSGHRNRIFALQVTALSDGMRVLVSCGADNMVKVWQLPGGQPLYSLSDDEDVTWNLCMATYRLPWAAGARAGAGAEGGMSKEVLEGPIVVVGCKNATLRVWRLPNAELGPVGDSRPARVVRGHSSRVHAVFIYGYRTEVFIATACRDANIRIWSLAGELIRTLRSAGSAIQKLSALDVSDERGGSIIACGLADGNLKLWKHSTGEVLRYFNGHTEEITALALIDTPKGVEWLVVISASKDKNVRTWLYAKEKSLRVIRHQRESYCSRVNALAVYAEGDTVAIFSVCDDGYISCWMVGDSDKSEEGFVLAWRVLAHKQRIRAIALYEPPSLSLDEDIPDSMASPMVVTGGRSGRIRVSSIANGEEMRDRFLAHDFPITSIAVYSGDVATSPFIVSASEDHLIKVWSLCDCSLLFQLEGHEFDVTAVRVFLPTVSERGVNKGPVIVSGSMDNTVRLWSHQSQSCLRKIADSSAPISSVAVFQISGLGAILAAGDTDGHIYVWSLEPPYELKHRFKAHADEVCSLDMFDVEGHHPVLLSGSWDTTVSVWDLLTMEYKRTLEGHTGQGIRPEGGNDAAVATCSTDMSVRVLFDFLGSIPKTVVIRHMFLQDLAGTSTHLQLSSDTAWPRVNEAIRGVGLEAFFSIHYELFADALDHNRPDFLHEFLGHSRAGLVKCNSLDVEGNEDFTFSKRDPNLLMRAIKLGNRAVISIVVDCWCTFLGVLPSSDADPLYDLLGDDYFQLDVMEALARHSPREFEKLICSVRLVPVKGNRIPAGSSFLVSLAKRRGHNRSMELRTDTESFVTGDYYYYLPLPYFASARQLKLFDHVCNKINSVSIFNSEAGSLILSYSWLSYGVRGHLMSMGIYAILGLLALVDIFLFSFIKLHPELYYTIASLELALDAYYLRSELNQFWDEPGQYFKHVWNWLDLVVIIGNAGCVLLRCIYWEDGVAYKITASLFSIALWTNVLHYLRAFESTGPLVSMVLQISNDIKYLIFLLCIFMVAFAQAFWVVASDAPLAAPTGSFDRSFDSSLLTLFAYMVGDYQPADISGSSDSVLLDSYLKVLSVVYMGIVSVLLLNLLIALMGDSFGTVKTDALAHWARHKAQLCIDVGASDVFFRGSAKSRPPVLYVRSDSAPVSEKALDAQQSLEKKVDEMMALLLVLKAHMVPQATQLDE